MAKKAKKRAPRKVQRPRNAPSKLALKKKVFLDAYSKTGNVTFAALAAKIDRNTHHNTWMKEPKYIERFEKAKAEACDRVEAEITRRAVHGIDKPIYYKDQKIDVIKQYSDVLLMFKAKGMMPEKYREVNSWHVQGSLAGTGGAAMGIDVRIVQDAIRDAEKES